MSHGDNWLKFTVQDFTNISDNPLSDYTHIFQYFSDWIDGIQASTSGDTWRPIEVNGLGVKGSDLTSGAINFGSDSNHNVVFSYDNSTIMANVDLDLSGYVPTSRKINNKALISDITLTYSDIGAASSSHTHSNYVTIDTDQNITGLKTFTQRPLSNTVYTQLEYIESSATSTSVYPYIKTGVRRGTTYSDTESLSCVFDGYFTASQTLGFFGYDGGGQLGQRNGYWSTEGGNSNVSALTRATVLQVINFSGNYDRLYIGGSQIATRTISTAASHSINGDYPLFVAYNGNYTYQPAKARLYSFKMYIGDYYTSPSSCTLIRDFIPAKSSTGEIGLLDLVENKFYVNSGTENFIAGPDVTTVTTASPLVITADVSKVGFSNNYNDLDNKPSIPSVNNVTITLQQNGVTVDSFTLNQSNSKTINFTTPTKDSDLTNDRYVRYDAAQTLSTDQQTTARSNIGAGTSNFTGYTASNKLSTNYINNVAGWTAVTESTVNSWGFTKNTGTVTSVDSVSPSSGNVALSAVRYVSQSLTDAQKTQARTNIGAGTSNFTGYSLTNQLSGYFIDNVQGWTSNTGTVSSVNQKSPGVNGNVTIGVDDISGLGSTLTQLSSDIANRVPYDDIQTTSASDSTKIPTIAYVSDMIGSSTEAIKAIEDVTELPIGSAINEHKFYRLSTFGEEIIIPIPSDDTTAFSNIVFNTALSVDEVTSIITNPSIAYIDVPAEQSPVGRASLMYSINFGNHQKKYQYTIVWVTDLDLAFIANETMLESMSSGSQTDDDQLIWTNNSGALGVILGGVSLTDGWDPMATGILMDPIAPIYFLNDDTEVHVSNDLLKNLVYCTKMTNTLKIKEIYEDNVAGTTHTQYIKNNLGTLKLNVVDTMPTTVNTALMLVYTGLANYTIWATDNNNYAIVALFVENTSATRITPYLLGALITDPDSDNPTINTSYAAIGPVGPVMSNFLGETYGTITADVEPIKNIVLYHHKDDTWYDVGSGLDPRFVVGTTAEIAAMSDDELQGKVVILTDETENYQSTLEAIQEQVSSAMVNVAHISDIPRLEINGVATNRINIQTGITDGFAKSVSWTSTEWIQSGQATADSSNNIDITAALHEITSQVTRNYQSQLLTNTSQTWESVLASWPYQFHYLYQYGTGTDTESHIVWLDTTHWTGIPRFDVTAFLFNNGSSIGAQRKSVIALNDDIYTWTPETLVTEQGSIFSSITTHSSSITDPQLYHNTGGSLSIIQSVILRNTNAATDYQVLVPNVANVVDMSPWFENLPDVVTAAGQTLGTNTIVLGSGSQTVKSSNYIITSDTSHITGSASAAANEIPTAAAVHDAIATVNNLRASYSSGILTLTVE